MTTLTTSLDEQIEGVHEVGLPDIYDRLTPPQGRLFIVSGPSGVGKDAVLAALFAPESTPSNLLRCITATTRAPRPGEVPGRDYFFFSRAEFEARIETGFFLEHATYNGDYYGTPHDYPDAERAKGYDVVLKIEVQGALQVKTRVPEAILIFLAPPSWNELERRLRCRATDDEAKVARRLAIARKEMRIAESYDYLVINDEIPQAAATLSAIIRTERCRICK